MKRIIFICCILLAIFAIGTVSASDANATSDSLMIDDESSPIEAISDESLKSNPDSELLSVDNSSGTFSDLNTIIVNSNKNSEIKLDKDYIYNNATDYSLVKGIQISKRLTIDGQGHKIDGLNLSRIFYVTANGVSLKNIIFANANSNGDIENRDGGAIYWQGERGTVSDCSFENCTASRGGAICGFNLRIDDSSFVNCYSTAQENDAGGALALDESTVFNCIFVNCLANSQGGAVRLYDFNITKCSFINCSSQWASALLLSNKGIVSDCMFENCFSNNSAILLNGEHEASIVNCTFINCHSDEYSGAIDITGNNNILDCNFINCSSINAGGAISWHSNGILSNCSFTNCSSAEGGGAIYIMDVIYNITDCTFKDCYTNGGTSGAIWGTPPSSGSIYNCRFISNVGGGGGAIWADCCNISYSSFVNCSADGGGAITGDNDYIFKCDFTDCHANGAGAVGVGSNSCVSECNFLNCWDNDHGGAILIGGENVKVNDCSFVNCSSKTGGSISFWIGDDGKSIEISNCNFENSQAYDGAAISVYTASDFIISKCNFTNCHATNSAGAIYTNSMNGTLSDCSFIRCTAENKGGAIVIFKKDTTVVGCSFDECESDYGGAIYIENDNSIIADCEFKNNKVYEYGGAIYSCYKSAIKNSTFKGNDAFKGKAIYTDASDMILTSNKLTHPAGESRNDLVYGVPVDSLKYANEIYNGDRLVIAPKIDIDYTDLTLGEDENVKVSLPNDAPEKITITLSKDGEIIKTAEYALNNGMVSETYAKLGLGVYNITVGYPGDVNYWDTEESVVFMVRPPVDITQNVTVGEDAGISIDLVNATGSVKVIIDGVEYKTCPIVDNKLNIDFNTNDLAYGNHNVTFEYIGSGMDKNVFKYWDNETNTYIPFNYDLKLNPAVIDVKEDEFEKSNDEGEVIVELPTDATGTITVFIEGQKELVFDVVKGFAKIDLSSMKDGNYQITYEYSGDKKYSGFTKETNTTLTNNVPEKIIAKDATVTYANKYSVTVKTKTDGGASGVKVNFLINNKLYGSAKTNTNGVASITITKTQATYKITSQVENLSVTKKLKVKHLVTLKTATVKKSAKKLVLTATLGKVNGKYLKNKQVTFKFNGKTYKAKTNSKGVAKYTIKSNVLKKLKVGKKITYQATYQKDTVKKTAKIKK